MGKKTAACFLVVAWALAGQGFRLRDAGPDAVELTENGKPVFVYNYGMVLKPGAPEAKRRSSYIHPLYAPDGTVVTDDFPKDHLHHRGLFWAWPIVKTGGETYDPWAVQGSMQTRFVRWIARKAGGKSAQLSAENGWFAGERKCLREVVDIRVAPAGAARREIAVELTLEPAGGPVTLQGAQENRKGYGGFSIRFAPRQETVITTDAGREARDTDMKPHPWAQLEGVFDGRPAGVRIDVDPSNPGAPNGWCLRHYGFLGVNYPGVDPLTLEPGRPLRMKYTVTVFSRASGLSPAPAAGRTPAAR